MFDTVLIVTALEYQTQQFDKSSLVRANSKAPDYISVNL